MEKFAGYGFNKSHAAAYALVAYQTAYLKAHHAAAFMAANLSAVMDDTDKVRQFHEDALRQRPGRAAARHQRLGLPLRAGGREDHPLRPGRGQGHRRVGDRRHRRGAQGSGPFTDLFDFCRRVDKRIVNRRVVEALVRAGAFDALERPTARACSPASGVALEAAEQAERARGTR